MMRMYRGESYGVLREVYARPIVKRMRKYREDSVYVLTDLHVALPFIALCIALLR